MLNAESASIAKVMENKELSDLVTALGCGIGKGFDLSRLRYGRVIILADADSDGHHIATLLLTFIYRHMPQLIREGKVYLAQPPLYRIDIGKETHWALDEKQKDDILKRLRRIEGQSRGLQRMVEEEQYCIDILTQISALTSALEAVAVGLLEDHLRHCVVDAAKLGGPEADAKITEASQAIARLVR